MGSHFVHLEEQISWKKGIELFQNRGQFLAISQPPDQHPAKIGPTNQTDDPQFLREEPARAAKMTTSDEKACQDVRAGVHDLVSLVRKIVHENKNYVPFGVLFGLQVGVDLLVFVN